MTTRRMLSKKTVALLAFGLAGCSGGADPTSGANAARPPALTAEVPARPGRPPGAADTRIAPVGSSAAEACAALLGTADGGFPANTQIVVARLVAASGTDPEHCEVKGVIDGSRTGAQGQVYGIKWHMRLPSEWNGRLYFGGGGGINGSLGDAKGGGVGGSSALALRYAVVTTDSGHANAPDPDFGAFDSVNFTTQLGPATFAFDPEARVDHGYRSYGLVARAAKATLARYYGGEDRGQHGRLPYYSYFQGCSEGGREALLMSQRFPDEFDGIVAGNPGMDLPAASIAEVWDSQALASAAVARGQLTASGDPWLNNALTPAQLIAVGNAILAACDALDGAVDGLVLNPEACTGFDVATLGPAGSGVLSAEQVAALEKIVRGPSNSSGQHLYSGWFWDPGMAAFGWRIWKMGPYDGKVGGVSANGSLNLSPFAGGSAIAYVWPTPPNSPTKAGEVVTSPWFAPDAFTKYVLSFDIDADVPKFFATNDEFKTSEYDLLFTSSTDYDRFRNRGARLLVYSGAADPVFSSRYHIEWYKRLASRYGSYRSTQEFARLFVVPGMNHCGGGIATDAFDAFGAVVAWVEKGIRPDSIVATARASNAELGLLTTGVPATRVRPLCPYPRFARFVGGEGASIEDPANFACRASGEREE